MMYKIELKHNKIKPLSAVDCDKLKFVEP